MLTKRIGLLVIQLRKNKMISVEELARRAEVSRSTIIRIENGSLNTNIYTLAKVCDGLDLDLSGFFKILEAKPLPSKTD